METFFNFVEYLLNEGSSVFTRERGVINFYEVVWCREGDSNPHEVTLGRFWVYYVYQFRHLGTILTELNFLTNSRLSVGTDRLFHQDTRQYHRRKGA